uniref:Uncharacterized protein n=1 Tax=Rhizophora mucronata TaxID=61149 RepID=A0A2P2QBS9_RHIMU
MAEHLYLPNSGIIGLFPSLSDFSFLQQNSNLPI